MAGWFQSTVLSRLARVASFLALGIFAAEAQHAREWRVYNSTDGMADTFTATVTTGPSGNLVATHHEGETISILDGYNKAHAVKAFGQGDYRVLEDISGALWTVYPEGLAEFKDGAWVTHPVPDVEQEFKSDLLHRLGSNWVLPVGLERVLLVVPARLFEFNGISNTVQSLRSASQGHLGRFSDLAPGPDGGLWVVGSNGVALFAGAARSVPINPTWNEFVPPADLAIHNLHRPQPTDVGGLVLVADQGATNNRVIVSFSTNAWRVIPAPRDNIRFAWAGLDGRYWAATISALFSYENGNWHQVPSEALPTDQFLDLAIEPGGVFWLATSDGAFRYTPSLWRSPPRHTLGSGPVLAFAPDHEGFVWWLQSDGLHAGGGTNEVDIAFTNHVGGVSVRSRMLAAANGSLIFDGNGKIFSFDPRRRVVRQISPEDNVVRQILGRIDRSRIVIEAFSGLPAQHPSTYEWVDRDTLAACNDLPDDLDLGGRDQFVAAAQNGDIWLAGSAYLAQKSADSWHIFNESDPAVPRLPEGFLDLGDGRIWVNSRDRIHEWDGKGWTLVPGGRINGIHAMMKGHDGSIWVAAATGLFRYADRNWSTISEEDGLPSSSATSLFEDKSGRLWVGTVAGPILYHPEADTDPPQTVIGRTTTDRGDSAEIVFSGRDKWKITPPDRLLYSYRLDEGDWRPFGTEHIAEFSDLPPGKHLFYARAMDRNWNVESRALAYEFSIILPWYKDIRLIFIATPAALAIAFFAALALNRHLQLKRSYAEVERIVTLRTEQLEKANRELVHGQKMTALGTLAAGVAHDFNNILSIIKGSAQIIEGNLDDREKIRTRVQRIRTVVDQGAAIVKSMLGFGGASDEKPVPCDVNALVENTVRLLGDKLLEETTIEFDWAPALPSGRGVRDFVQQILLNFIFNARDAMSGRGRIVVRTGEIRTLPSGLDLAPDAATHYVFVSVKDHGTGIPPDVRQRIFEPFFTTKAFSARRGTGLGLSMVYEMARAMGAGLRVESTQGQGSTFTLILPVPVIPAAQTAASLKA